MSLPLFRAGSYRAHTNPCPTRYLPPEVPLHRSAYLSPAFYWLLPVACPESAGRYPLQFLWQTLRSCPAFPIGRINVNPLCPCVGMCASGILESSDGIIPYTVFTFLQFRIYLIFVVIPVRNFIRLHSILQVGLITSLHILQVITCQTFLDRCNKGPWRSCSGMCT